jgi:hypothetical protein
LDDISIQLSTEIAISGIFSQRTRLELPNLILRVAHRTRMVSLKGTAPFVSEQFISSLDLLYSILAIRSFQFFPEPFPKPRIIKPDNNHHHAIPKSGRQTDNNPHCSSFLK